MKVRTGFVSNSSSSSFIVAFKKTPTSILELQHMMFGDRQFVDYGDNTNPTPTYVIAARVWADLHIFGPADKTQIIEVLSGGGVCDPRYEHSSMDEEDDEDEKETAEVDKEYRALYGDDANRGEHEDWNNAWHKANVIVWDRRRKRWDQAAWNYYSHYMEEFHTKVVYILAYEDQRREHVLEHGEIFASLTHRRISCH